MSIGKILRRKHVYDIGKRIDFLKPSTKHIKHKKNILKLTILNLKHLYEKTFIKKGGRQIMDCKQVFAAHIIKKGLVFRITEDSHTLIRKKPKIL